MAFWALDHAPGATRGVTSLADSGPGTLRQAIFDASPGDDIVVVVPGTIMIFGSFGQDAAELMISKDLAISGLGPDRLVLSQTAAVRPLFLSASNATVRLSGLCLSNAAAVTTDGGATLTLSNCTVCADTAFMNHVGCGLVLVNSRVAGNLFPLRNNGGFLSLSGCAVADNRCGVAARPLPGTNLFVNCTFSRNEVAISGPNSVFFLTNCTIAGNFAKAGVSGLYTGSGSAVHLFNTIIAGNRNADGSAPDCAGSFDSLDYNLIGNTNGCTITNLTSHNIYGVDPRLGALGDCGGPTPTMPPLSGSPAIDAGAPTGAPPIDQRGRARPFGESSDIGALESCPPYVLAGRVSGFTLRDEIQLQINLTNILVTRAGNFRLFGVLPGNYNIVPSDPNYLFAPTNRLITIGPDCTDADIKAYHWNCVSFEGLSSNAMNLAFPGTNGQTFQLLGSTDLAGWAPLSTNTVPASNLLEFTTPLTNSINFYRTANQ
jgi:hypothetical protein